MAKIGMKNGQNCVFVLKMILFQASMTSVDDYFSSNCRSRDITWSSNLTIYVVPLCQWAVTLQGYEKSINQSITIESSRKNPRKKYTYKTTITENGFNYSSWECCTIQRALIFRHTYEFIDQWFFFYDIIRSIIIIGMLQLLCFFPEQTFPQSGFDE